MSTDVINYNNTIDKSSYDSSLISVFMINDRHYLNSGPIECK